MSLAEAAEIYGFNPKYLSQLARKGRLNAQRVDRAWIITPADMEIYIRSQQKKGAHRDEIQVDPD